MQACEALARWTTPAGDVVPPDVFIPVAEETGLIGELGQLVLGTAVREAVAWQPLGKVGLRVNVSAHELRAPTFFAGVQGTLASSRPRQRRCWASRSPSRSSSTRTRSPRTTSPGSGSPGSGC